MTPQLSRVLIPKHEELKLKFFVVPSIHIAKVLGDLCVYLSSERRTGVRTHNERTLQQFQNSFSGMYVSPVSRSLSTQKCPSYCWCVCRVRLCAPAKLLAMFKHPRQHIVRISNKDSFAFKLPSRWRIMLKQHVNEWSHYN